MKKILILINKIWYPLILGGSFIYAFWLVAKATDLHQLKSGFIFVIIAFFYLIMYIIGEVKENINKKIAVEHKSTNIWLMRLLAKIHQLANINKIQNNTDEESDRHSGL